MSAKSKWDKLWDRESEKVHTSFHPEAHLDEWLKRVKETGDELQFLLNSQTDLYGKECSLHGKDLDKLEKIKRFANRERMLQSVTHQTIANNILKILEEE